MKLRVFAIMMLSLFLVPPVFASKESSVKKGNQFYKKGDFESSLKNYENAFKAAPESPEVNYNLGTALYKNKKYSDAVEHLQKSLLSSDKSFQKNAHFNLGNALFEAGLGIKDKEPDQAIKSLEESLRQFDTVMNLDDKDVDAKYNHDIVKKELERLKKEKEQQNQQNKQNQQSQQSKQGDEKKEDHQQQQDQQKQDQQGDSSQSDSQKKDQKQQQSQSPDDKKDNQKPSFKPEDQQKQDHGGKKDQESKETPSSSGGAAGGEMTKKEAKDLLKQFEQNEQPAGLLNFDRNKSEERPVLKDW